ncbi:ADP compounds hydrolase NudE, partial [Methylococcaceae bacterium HT1]
MLEKPKILNRKIVAQSRLFKIEALDLEFSNGATRQYERLMRGSGSN